MIIRVSLIALIARNVGLTSTQGKIYAHEDQVVLSDRIADEADYLAQAVETILGKERRVERRHEPCRQT